MFGWGARNLRYDKRMAGWVVASGLASLLNIALFILALFGGGLFGIHPGVSVFFALIALGCLGMTMYFYPRAFYRRPSDVYELFEGWPKSLHKLLLSVFIASLVLAFVVDHLIGLGASKLLWVLSAVTLLIGVLYTGWWSGKIRAELDWRRRHGNPELELPLVTRVITRKSEQRSILLTISAIGLVIMISLMEDVITGIAVVGGLYGMFDLILGYLPRS